MTWTLPLLRLGLAALIAGAGAAVALLTLLFVWGLCLTGAGPPGAPGAWVGVVNYFIAALLPVALAGGVVGGPPSLICGGLMWMAAADRPWARKPAAWAGAGAFAVTFPILLYAILCGGQWAEPVALVVIAPLAAGGSVAALIFRWMMLATAPAD